MANDVRMGDQAVNVEADAVAPEYNNGYIRIYSVGSGRPATADTAVTDQVLLAELRFGATAFGAAASGVLTANAITADASANNTNTAAWYRCLKADGTTALNDGECGTSGSDMNLNTLSIVAGANVSISAFTHTVTK